MTAAQRDYGEAWVEEYRQERGREEGKTVREPWSSVGGRESVKEEWFKLCMCAPGS